MGKIVELFKDSIYMASLGNIDIDAMFYKVDVEVETVTVETWVCVCATIAGLCAFVCGLWFGFIVINSWL